jgi:TRAP-type mannitol/chloroaromatic compound transport system substrate-binding protein
METTMTSLMRWSAAAVLIATLPFATASSSYAAWHHHGRGHFGWHHHYHGGGAGSFISRPRNAESA